MATLEDRIAQARSDAQTIHKQLEANASDDVAAVRAANRRAVAEAQKLAATVGSIVADQGSEVKEHLEKAKAALQDAVKGVESAAQATDAQVRTATLALLTHVRAAVDNLSHAVAAQRSTRPATANEKK